jgi:2,3-bisphosphoglycerate-independent phosphoglycerate mutase
MSKKVALLILDGWGLGDGSKSDAVFQAQTPFTDMLTTRYPHATLRTDGEYVGLPNGQMGNSEVGHMNIGAGRVVWQMLAKINKVFEQGELDKNATWNDIIAYCEQHQKPLHLMGLLSDGGVHAHIDHLLGLIRSLKQTKVPKVFIHAFLDGRDTDPQSGFGFLERLLAELDGDQIALSSVVGRYFAMDRDERWERVRVAYDVMVHGTGTVTTDVLAEIRASYQQGTTDEFMNPVKIGSPEVGVIRDGDAVLCFNFRTDRGRQITRALTQESFEAHQMEPLDLEYVTFTEYDETFHISGVLFENENLNLTLGEVISHAGKSQLRAAETEKYPHVTFFFSGGREERFPQEERIMAPSPKVATYDLQPEMSAVELTQKVLEYATSHQPDFICLNYANADMVGHTGVYEAIVRAVETVDHCVSEIVQPLLELSYEVLIIADHGNADVALNQDGTPNTAHSTNPVPVWYVSNQTRSLLHDGALADVAPTILELMGIAQPTEMNGTSLLHA